MVGKISTGSYAKGLFDYLTTEKESSLELEKEPLQRVRQNLTSEIEPIIEPQASTRSNIVSSNMYGKNAEDLTKEFLIQSSQNPNIGKPVKHFMISFSEEDKQKLNPQKLDEITQDYLKGMSYDNTQYVAFLHSDTSKDHLHIVCNRIDNNGKTISDSFEKKQSRTVLMKLEQKYDLTKTPEKTLNPDLDYNLKNPKIAERSTLDRNNFKSDIDYLKSFGKEILNRNPKTEQQFKKLLNSSGVKLSMNKAENGYNFDYKGRTYKASSINRELSKPSLDKKFNQHKEQDQKLDNSQGLSRKLER